MRFLLIFSFLFASICGMAQSTDEKLAAQFYDNGEYEKAEGMYKKLFRQFPQSSSIYNNYLNTLLALKDQKTSEKTVEKHLKQNPGRINIEVDLGYVYLQFEEKDKASKYFSKLTKKYINDRNTIIILAQSLGMRQLADQALEVYEAAARKQGILMFYPQLISSYRLMGKTKKLTDFSLEVLLQDVNTFDYVTRSLDILYEKEEASVYLQQRTLIYAQKNPNNQVFDELLLEVFLQQKKYSSALRQVISLDKRNKSDGDRTLQLAKTCVKNHQYATAIKGYEYVMGLGKDGIYYLDAEQGLIKSLYLKITSTIDPNKEEVKALIDRIQGFVNTNGTNYKTAKSMYLLAELQLFYNDNVSTAITILETIIKTPRLQSSFAAKSKLLLGDAYLMQNNIWDAKLMYGQVDKQFKEDALGQEAKFKSAKLSYFTGDFEWAKSQLDILKTATSQLISNNAIDLALLIQDNTGLDSTEDAMIEYAKAEFLLYQNQVEKSSQILNMLPFKYPNHTLNDEIYYLKAQVQEKQGNYVKANELYSTIIEKYSQDILADNALFRSARITLYMLKDREKAITLFEKLILDYNASLYAVDARKMYYGLKEGKDMDEMFFNGFVN